MREDLLGYLLGALEPDEVERIEARLEVDPQLQEELREIERSLRPLESEAENFEPPVDLVSRTMDFIEASKPEPAKVQMSESRLEHGSGRRLRIPDALVAAVSLIAFGGLLFPAILEGRFESRRTQCQDNLRQLGIALTSFTTLDPTGRFPEIALDGPLAFAGIYSVELKDRNILDQDNLVLIGAVDVFGPEGNLPPVSRAAARGQNVVVALVFVELGPL